MQNFTKIAAIVLIVASCALALEASNVEEHTVSKRVIGDFHAHYEELSKRAQERFKKLFLRRAEWQTMLKRATSELSKKANENKAKLTKVVNSINIKEIIKEIDDIENFLEKVRTALNKIADAINWLKTTGKIS